MHARIGYMAADRIEQDHPGVLSYEQKQRLYRDGYIVLKRVVPKELTQSARSCIAGVVDADYSQLGTTAEMLNLVNASPLSKVLRNTMGAFDPPTRCQVAVRPITKPGKHFINTGASSQVVVSCYQVAPGSFRYTRLPRYFGRL